MRLIKACAALLCMMAVFAGTNAQRIKLIEGDLTPLKNEKKINTEFTYDHMSVGKFDKEEDYIAKKKDEYNKKESGKGDKWAKDWVADRQDKFEPKFNDLFEKESEMATTGSKKEAKYTLIYKTTSTEPGFNIAIMRHNAETNAEVWIVEAANHSKVIAKISVQKAQGRTFWGEDYETGGRIAECYADAGKALGRFIRKEIK
jgi:hypothetical protein